MNYLKAIIAVEKTISSTEVMHRYQIVSTTSISCSKDVLIKNDTLNNKADAISFQDPIYTYWLKTVHSYDIDPHSYDVDPLEEGRAFKEQSLFACKQAAA